MTAPPPRRSDATYNFNHLRRGDNYLAITSDGVAFGEYMGMEAPYGDKAILLRHRNATSAVALSDITSILALAA
jgi:hypothetical protein